MTIETLDQRLSALTRRYDTLNGQYQSLTQQAATTQHLIDKHQQTIQVLEETQHLLQHLQHVLVDESLKEIEGLVSDCLSEVFPDQKLTFRIEQLIERGRTSLDFYLLDHRSDPPAKRDLLDSSGGGVVSVISFLLRIIAIKKLNLYPFLALDESFAQVSEQYVPNVAKMVRQIADKLGIDIFLVTHQYGFLSGAHTAMLASHDPVKGITLKVEDAI